MFEVVDSAVPTLEIVDAVNHDDWRTLAERELGHRFDLTEPPLGRLSLLRLPGGTASDLVVTFPHALVDGTAVTQFIDEVLSRLAGGPENSRSQAPKDQLPPSCDELFPAKWRRPRRVGRSLRFLARQMGDELNYRLRTRGRHSRPPAGPFRNQILPLSLTRDETTNLVRASRKRQVSLVSTLEAAMLLAVVRHRYPDMAMPHRYCAFPLLRKYLEPPVADDVIACYVTVLRLTAIVSPTEGLWDLATRIHHDLDRSMRRGERFLASVWSHFSMRTLFSQTSHRMSTTALSYTGATRLESADQSELVSEIHAFVSNFPIGPEYTAQARIFDSRLWLDILYLSSDMDRNEAQRIAEDICELLTSI